MGRMLGWLSSGVAATIAVGCLLVGEVAEPPGELEPGHDERFWALVAQSPRAERARGFLEGVELGASDGVVADEGPADPVD